MKTNRRSERTLALLVVLVAVAAQGCGSGNDSTSTATAPTENRSGTAKVLAFDKTGAKPAKK